MRKHIIITVLSLMSILTFGNTLQSGQEKSDMVALILYNPKATTQDFIAQGLYGKNIYIQQETAYYRYKDITTNPKFRNRYFQFDKNKFHHFYLSAKKIAVHLQNYKPYSKWDIFAPIDQRNYRPRY